MNWEDELFDEIHELESVYFLKHYTMGYFHTTREAIIKVLKQKTDSLLKQQRDRDRLVYDNLVHTYYKFQSFLKDALLDYQRLEWEHATGKMEGAKKKYDQMWSDINAILNAPEPKKEK